MPEAPPRAPHYDEEYFAWQRDLGQFGAWADLPKFAPYVRPTDRVVDFGCGGGYLLDALEAAERIGVEVNPAARAAAAERGLDVRPAPDALPEAWADVAVSNHALEHCAHPLAELEALRPKVRPGGRFVCVVPSETARRAYDPADHNRHLYTWSPLNLGHLFDEAGYVVEEAEEIVHRWPPFASQIARVGGRPLFDLASRAYGRLRRSVSQVRVVARVPE